MTAADIYATRLVTVRDQIEALRAQVEAHARRAAANPDDWNLAGDLGHALDRLRDLVAFLSASAVIR